jgi:alanine dehydrogenase
MLIGVPKETKPLEYRVGMTPAGVDALIRRGHTVWIERDAGTRCGFVDDDYVAAGALVAGAATDVYACDLVVKVKELQPSEYALLRRGQIVFGFQQLAPDATLLQAVLDAGIAAIAYETVEDAAGRLPLLAPMSRIAGRMAVQLGAWALQMGNGGSGVLLPGIPGVPPARVAVVGAGVAGRNAVQVAAGMGADVTVLDVDLERLEALDAIYRGRIKTCYSTPLAIAEQVERADLVIAALLVRGRLSPKLVTRQVLRRMRPGSVLLDIGIDQGGIAETSRMSSHAAPLYVEEGIVHYCVPNIPAACARTATLALTQATLPYVVELAAHGLAALRRERGFARGLQAVDGEVVHDGLAADCGRPLVAWS